MNSSVPKAASVRSPKLAPAYGRPPTPAFQYYAGYDAGFVKDALAHLKLTTGGVVVDPWHGSGTTAVVAFRNGYGAVAIDINPALVVVGKARLLGVEVAESLDALTHDILQRASSPEVPSCPREPLEQWFTAGTSRYFRSIEASIQRLLVKPENYTSFVTDEALDKMSSLAAAFYVVLFETVRSFLTAYRTSNPTWMKKGGAGETRLSPDKERIRARFRAMEKRLHHHLRAATLTLKETQDTQPSVPRIVLGSSTNLDLADHSVDAALASPPYCTRIDYAVLTRPELAVLGIGDDTNMRRLRDGIIGTPTVIAQTPTASTKWGSTANAFLNKVSGHTSKASKSYYLKYFLQYFDSMYVSLTELHRVLKDEAPCGLVVQDSYYKEVHNDLATSLVEMGREVGWKTSERLDFPVARTRAAQNAAARQYRETFSATESLVILRH